MSVKPRLSPAQQKVVDAMLEGVRLEDVFCPMPSCPAHRHWRLGGKGIHPRTFRALFMMGVIGRYAWDDWNSVYRLTPEWQAGR